MAQFKIVKPIIFGNFTILNQDGCPSCFVPINDYAPKVGQIIEGEIVTRRVPDGNGGFPIRTGLIWSIMTNRDASTQGQRSIQFIDIDHLQSIQEPGVKDEAIDSDSQDNSGDEVESHGPSNPETPFHVGSAACWMCENKVPVITGVIIIIGLVVIFSQD